MTKAILLAISVILMSGVVACSSQDEKKTSNTSSPTNAASISQQNEAKDVREAIWNQLPAKEKKRIAGTWEDATVSTVTLTKQMAKHSNSDESYIGKEVYIIYFKIKKVQYPDSIAFYADKKTFKLIAMAILD